jgi:omega-6 fatty acid desaturase (delta-12 desaturase)
VEKVSLKNDWSNWVKIMRLYNRPNSFKSIVQILNSVLPYLGLWVLMYYSLTISYWFTFALSILAAGFLIRIFIIFHDCGHGSFFKSVRTNKLVGIIAGLLVFTPYHKWHYQHKVHHQTVGNLDKRGVGDVMTLTVEEYKSRTPAQRLVYRLYRNPFVLFLIAPFVLFTILHRFPNKELSKKINLYTHITTIALIVIITLMSLWIGFKTFLLIQVPIIYFAAVFGVWLFYLQHQYKEVVWEREKDWDYQKIAMEGSSYIKFPRILQWFSGNIGIHHIHHLNPKIPNYNLEKCLVENPIFQKKPMHFLDSLKTIHFRLWDEKNHQLVSFKEALI